MRILSFDISYDNLILDRQVDEHGYEINQLLTLLVKSLLVIGNVGPQASQNTVKHLIDALTSVFECKELGGLQKSLITLISSHQINTFITRNCMDFERVENNYKCTMSYLKFATRIFELESPQMLLCEEHQIKLNSSFLDEILRVVYSEVIAQFPGFNFSSVGHFAKFSTRILEFTKVLIKKFDAGNNSPLKLEIA